MADPQRVLKQYLHSLHKAGVTHVPRDFLQVEFPETAPPGSITSQQTSVAVETALKAKKKVEPAKKAATTPAASTIVKPAETTSSTDQLALHESSAAWIDLTQDQKESALTILQNEVADCTRCTELAETRTQTVFGVGNPQSKLVFLGEAPGADEDRLGEPFVGLAGQKLDEIIENGMRLKRSDVYIMNVLRCRPPGNRNPSQDEAQNCRGFLDRQLAIIKPEFICCLGGVAATRLLDSRLTIGRMRGKFYDYMGAKVMATYHPAYLLRNPSARNYVWEDIKMLMREMGLVIPGE